MDWFNQRVDQPDPAYYQKALERQRLLTKPPGSLGKLEELATRLAAMQKTETPSLERVRISVFAADHGISEEGVSAFPSSVTMEMVRNFSKGGAAINVLAEQIDAGLEIVDVGIHRSPGLDNVIESRAGNGTGNFLKGEAMTAEQLKIAIGAGKMAVDRAKLHKTQLLIGGEMGIGNTTSATAILSALTGVDASEITGAGTGLDGRGILRKTEVIHRALHKHRTDPENPLELLKSLGGFEIAALTGFYIQAAIEGIPVLVDGFIASVASMLAVKINSGVLPWLFYAHRSDEKGHQTVLDCLGVEPILNLQMRLGEGSGAAVAVPVLRAACALHNEMATFSQAGVSTGSG